MNGVLAYLRVSTDEQARSGLGMAAQRTAIQREADARNWTVEWLTDDGYSGGSLSRPALADALDRLANGRADVLVVAKLDRLSRSLVDFAGLMATAQRQGWSVVALDLGVDTTTASGEMMANVMASFAHYERRLIGQRTRDALAEKKAQGVRLGRPVELPDATRQRVADLRASGLSYRKVADQLTADGVPTARGGDWHGSTVRGVLRGLRLDHEAELARAT